MRFANPDFLWFLLLVPFMIPYLMAIRERNLPAFRFPGVEKLPGIGRGNMMRPYILIPGAARIAAVILIIIALARPQKGLRSEEMTAKATDIMICLDASRSMLAVDFKPDNRFQVAKNVITEFIKGRDQDRVG